MNEITSVPYKYSYLWLLKSWQFVKKNYFLSFTTMIMMGGMSVLFNLIPHFGQLLGTLMSVIITVGTLNIAAKIYHKENNVSFSDIFLFFTDKAVLRSLFPLLILRLIFEIPMVVSSFYFPEDSMIRISILIIFSMIVVFLISFSIPLMLFKNVTLIESIKLTLRGVSRNILVLFLSTMVVAFTALLSVISLVLPSIFIFLPLMLFYQYFIYITIFDGAVLESI